MKKTVINGVDVRTLKYSVLSDIFEPFTALRLNISISVSEIYNEAYMNNKIVSISTEEYFQSHFVVHVTEPTPTLIATNLINVLLRGEEKSVTYKGNSDPAALRTAAHRIAGIHGIKVSTKETFGVIVISQVRTDIKRITDILDSINTDEATALPVSLHTSLRRLRSVVTNYGNRYGINFTTRVVGDVLYVTKKKKTMLTDEAPQTGAEAFKTWLNAIPFDADYPALQFGLTIEHMRVIAHRTIGCTGTISEAGFARKRSLAKGKEKGIYTVRVNGYVIYARPDGYHEATIDSLLVHHGKTFKDIE